MGSSDQQQQQQFCLRWHNFQANLLASLPQFLKADDLTDVTLSAEGRKIRAHRVVLSASSQYFKEIFKDLQPPQHPVIVLPGMNFDVLCALLTFIYSGEVNVYQEQLPGLLSLAETLHIRGLTDVQTGEKPGDISGNSGKTLQSSTTTVKRPRLNSSPSLNQNMVYQNPNSTNNASNSNHLFKSPPIFYSEPKSFKDYNDNHAGLPRDYDIFKSYCGLPYDDSTLKMMSTKVANAKLSALSGREASRRMRRFRDLSFLDANVPISFSRSPLLDGIPPPFTADPAPVVLDSAEPELEAQDLTKVKNEQQEPDAETNTETTERQPIDLKSERQSPSSEDSGCSGQVIVESPNYIRITNNSLALHQQQQQQQQQQQPTEQQQSQSKGFATCPVCGKQLSNQYNLRVHMETHQNVQYSCHMCSHVSRSRDALRKHVSYRHPVEGKEKDRAGKIRLADSGLIPNKKVVIGGLNLTRSIGEDFVVDVDAQTPSTSSDVTTQMSLSPPPAPTLPSPLPVPTPQTPAASPPASNGSSSHIKQRDSQFVFA